MGIFALSALMVAGAGFYLFSQSFPNFKPGNNKIQQDLKVMREEVLKNLPDLIPLKIEDVEQLSSREMDKSLKKGFVINRKGIFITIFDEPAIAFYRRTYLSNSRDALLFAKSAKHEFNFWIRGADVQMVVDNQPLGVYNDETGVLIGNRSQKMIAQLDKTQEKMSLVVQGRAVGTMGKYRPGIKDTLSQRVFEFVKNDVTPEEEAILLAIGIYEMVDRS